MNESAPNPEIDVCRLRVRAPEEHPAPLAGSSPVFVAPRRMLVCSPSAMLRPLVYAPDGDRGGRRKSAPP